jgi:hypothetical protein
MVALSAEVRARYGAFRRRASRGMPGCFPLPRFLPVTPHNLRDRAWGDRAGG